MPDPFEKYFAMFPVETQDKMESVRKAIRSVAPDAVETIPYAIPTFKLKGKNLVHFAAYKSHIGFYPGADGIAHFSAKLSKYKSAKGSVQFPLSEEMPLALVKEITEFKVKKTLASKPNKGNKEGGIL